MKARDGVNHAVARLDSWLQTMRGPQGFAGPVSHWWESSLLFCGPMADWRYEGIICGYLSLYQSTEDETWIMRAKQAGMDLVRAQLPSGNFRNSSFQQGPMEGGTPHEAAADVGLLELARELRARGDSEWQVFFCVAERNLQAYQLDKLWNGTAFRDMPWNTTVVPNKNATTMEALLLYEELSGNSMEQYILGAANLVRSAQVTDVGPRQGATIHLGTGRHQLAIGIYTARCAAALIRLYERYNLPEYLHSASAMVRFLERLVTPAGSLFGVYPNGRRIACPVWISASGDLLRSMIALQPHAEVAEQTIDQLIEMLVKSQLASGGIPTAHGLAAKGRTSEPTEVPDFRDLLPVVGWCDKAFRALALLCTDVRQPEIWDVEQVCLWKDRPHIFRETTRSISLSRSDRGQEVYRWAKSSCFPDIYRL